MADDAAEAGKPSPPQVAFGAEISENRLRCAVAKAYRADGRITVEVVWYDLPAGAPAFLDDRYMTEDPVAIALDPKSQSATLIKPLGERGVPVTKLSAEDVAVAHGEFIDLVTGHELRQLDQPELTAAIRGAQQRSLAGAKAWERRVVTDQAPLNASTFAVWALQRYEELAAPGAWTI